MEDSTSCAGAPIKGVASPTSSVVVEEVEPGTRWRARTDHHVAFAWLGRLHRTHAWLEIADSVPPDDLRRLAAALAEQAGVPMATKAVPHTLVHEQWISAGATAFQTVPPSTIDLTDVDNLDWASSSELDPALTACDLTGLSETELTDMWLSFYSWTHADWSPVADAEHARTVFGPMLADGLDKPRSVLLQRAGAPAAHAFVFVSDGAPLICCEATDPSSPTAAADVLACLRTAVAGLAAMGESEVTCDGHVTDPHIFPALQTVPRVRGEGLQLLQLHS